MRRLDGPLTWLQIAPPLPCSVGCGRLATSALAEEDAVQPGLWQIAPVCATCREHYQPDPRVP